MVISHVSTQKIDRKQLNMEQKKEKKIYILDTNVLVFDPTSIFAFEKHLIGIPSVVLEELDKFKTEGTDRGRNTREVIRSLDTLREKGSLGKGVPLDNGGMVKVLFLEKELPPTPFRLQGADNEILLTALSYKNQGYHVVFISKDLNARIKADALEIETQDYVKEYVTADEFYHGWIRIKVPIEQLKENYPDPLQDVADGLAINEFVLLENENNSNQYKVFRYLGKGQFKSVAVPSFKWPLQPRNAQQLMALDLLLDHDIQLMTLSGPAGTGKTFLVLLAGLHQVLVDDDYAKMLISRPVVPLGRDIGYVPGTIEEKLHSWMQPIYDNVEFIMHEVSTARHFEELEVAHGRRKGKARKKYKKETAGLMPLDLLVHQGKVSMEAITYMRGRSIPFQFILIDEAQNLTPHEIKTLVTRVGEGSKIILTGDPFQIDSPYLDFSSNGLVTCSERFKGYDLFGSVFLENTERSELSKLAGKLL